MKDKGLLTERHVLMALALGLQAETISDEHRRAKEGAGLLLLQWLEDCYFAQFGTYSPVDESATPEAQQEHPAEKSLVPDPDKIAADYLRKLAAELGEDDDDPERGMEEIQNRIRQSERETPVSYGEIHDQDRAMLLRQGQFRMAAKLLAGNLAEMAEVRKVVLFGSTALPLWKEVPRFSRLKHRRIKVYHECNNIDLAVWVTSPAGASHMRKAASSTVNDLVASGIHFNLAHHHFSIHLVDHASNRYLGMVCHYSQCPKHKPECQVPGCGADKFVQILPWFKFKPERLNSHNSLVLFER